MERSKFKFEEAMEGLETSLGNVSRNFKNLDEKTDSLLQSMDGLIEVVEKTDSLLQSMDGLIEAIDTR